MSSKKWIAAALIGGFIFGNAMEPVNAGILDKVIKGGIVGVVVDKVAVKDINRVQGVGVAAQIDIKL